MKTTKQLPRGIPEGAYSTRQSIKHSPVVIVSEWARRVAHELDNYRGTWVAAVKADPIGAQFERSPYYQSISHAEWLSTYDESEAKHEIAVQREVYLKAVLSDMRRTKRINGTLYSKWEFDMHRNAVIAELDYVVALIQKLRLVKYARDKRITMKAEEYAKEQRRKFWGAVDADDIDPTVKLFAHLVSLLHQSVLVKQQSEIAISDELRNLIQVSWEHIRSLSYQGMPDRAQLAEDDRVWIDGFLSRRSDLGSEAIPDT